jgi:hypothetical protein
MVFDAALTRCYEAFLDVGDLNEYLVSFRYINRCCVSTASINFEVMINTS